MTKCRTRCKGLKNA